jgi:hypothetical protein
MPESDNRTEDSLVQQAKELAGQGDGCAIGKLLADVDVLERFKILQQVRTKDGESIGPDHSKIGSSQQSSVTWGNQESMRKPRPVCTR